MKCPCNSGLSYEQCCEVYHLRRLSPLTAEALMRSRYAAYVMGELAYLYDTTHPSVRSGGLKAAYQSTYDSIQWIGLEVLDAFQGGAGDKTGKVEFEATYIQGGQRSVHHEKSRFKRHAGKWHYLDGDVKERVVG